MGQTSAGTQERVFWVDWLRVIVVFGILLYHSALPFTHAPWIINNRASSLALDAFAVFCFQWGMWGWRRSSRPSSSWR